MNLEELIAAARTRLEELNREVLAIADAADMFDPDILDENARTLLPRVIEQLGNATRALADAADPMRVAEIHAHETGI